LERKAARQLQGKIVRPMADVSPPQLASRRTGHFHKWPAESKTRACCAVGDAT
jgi:hypothetical protein